MSSFPLESPVPRAATAQTVAQAIDRAAELQTLPVVLFEAESILQDPRAGAADLADLLQKDTALAGRILKMANSTYYGSRRRISSLPQAIVLLGFQTIKNLTLTVSVVDTFRPRPDVDFEYSAFWAHSLATAIAGETLAKMAGDCDPSAAYMAGLLHDIGRLLVAQHAPSELARVHQVTETGISTRDAEVAVWGEDHASLGARFLTAWDLPDSLVEAVRHHHGISTEPTISDIVQLADLIVSAIGLPCPGSTLPIASDSLNRRLGYDQENLAGWIETVAQQIDAAREFFELVGHAPNL